MRKVHFFMGAPESGDGLKERVRAASDLVQIVGERVPLKKKGSTWLGLCPFHPDRNPSFSVHPRRQFYKCWSCGKGGDVFSFLMEYDHLTFPEALRELAGRAGIEMPVGGAGRDAARERDRLGPLKEANARAAEVFHQYLLRAAGAAEGRDYVRARGFRGEWIRKWTLGFAPDAWQFLGRLLGSTEGDRERTLVAAGLLAEKDRRTYDFFRGRLLFPIRNERGEVLGFGGRAVRAGQEPKYLNTGETPLFLKKKNLYGLFQALPLLGREKAVWIVEGYLDVIACQHVGVPALAPLGTAFTEEQLQKVRRYGEKIHFCFDGDDAGRRAAEKAAALAVQGGAVADVVLLPQGQDPFDVLASSGEESLVALLRAPGVDVYAFLLDRWIPAGPRSPGETAALAQRVASFLPEIRDDTVRLEFLKLAAARLGVEPDWLDRHAKTKARSGAAPGAPHPAGAGSSTMSAGTTSVDVGKRPVDRARLQLERDFLVLLCRHPDHIQTVSASLFPGDFAGRDTRWLYEHLLALRGRSGLHLSDVLDAVPGERTRDWITREVLRLEDEEIPEDEDPAKLRDDEEPASARTVRMVMDWSTALREAAIRDRIEDAQSLIRALAPGEDERLASLQEDLAELHRLRLDLRKFRSGQAPS